MFDRGFVVMCPPWTCKTLERVWLRFGGSCVGWGGGSSVVHDWHRCVSQAGREH